MTISPRRCRTNRPRMGACALAALVLAGGLAPAARADEVAVQDVLSVDGRAESLPHFTGVTVDGLSGLLIMPTASRIEEGSARIAIVRYTPIQEVVTLSASAPGGKVVNRLNHTLDVVQPILTVRVGNRAEVSFGKHQDSFDAELGYTDGTRSNPSIDTGDDNLFGFKFSQAISRRRGYFVTLAGSSYTSRSWDPWSGSGSSRVRNFYGVLSQVTEKGEWSLGYRAQKTDSKSDGTPDGTGKRHQYGLGVQYEMAEDFVIQGEYWQKPKGEIGGEDETAFGVRYKPSERLEAFAGLADLLGTDSGEVYFGLSYFTKYGNKKPAATSQSPSPGEPSASADLPAETVNALSAATPAPQATPLTTLAAAQGQ